MSTRKKIESNRKNAQKSTGPRSQAGKVVVSQNARTHGLLSRNLIIEGESQEEFSAMLNLLRQEFQPVGMVENALIERVAISFWRQRRLVQAESAQVSINRQSLGPNQINEVCNALNLKSSDYTRFKYSEDKYEGMEKEEEREVDMIREEIKQHESFVNTCAHTDNPFAHLPKSLQKQLLTDNAVDANQIDSVIKNEYGSWAKMFEDYIESCKNFIDFHNFKVMSRLVLKSHTLPSQTDLLARYQTALDNDLYKALKALREAQQWRESKNIITATPLSQSGDTDK